MGNHASRVPTIPVSDNPGTITFKDCKFEQCWADASTNNPIKCYRLISLSFCLPKNLVGSHYYHEFYFDTNFQENKNWVYKRYNLHGYKVLQGDFISNCKVTRENGRNSHSWRGMWAGDMKPNDTIEYLQSKTPNVVTINVDELESKDNNKIESLKKQRKQKMFDSFKPIDAFIPPNMESIENDNTDNSSKMEQKEGHVVDTQDKNDSDTGDLCIDFILEFTKNEYKRYRDANTKWGRMFVSIPLSAIKNGIKNAIIAIEPKMEIKIREKRQNRNIKNMNSIKNISDKSNDNGSGVKNVGATKAITGGNMNNNSNNNNNNSINNDDDSEPMFVECPLCHTKGISRTLFKYHIVKECTKA